MSRIKKLNDVHRKEFNNYLKTKEFEDLDLIKTIDNLFIKKRGYVFKQPPAKSKVILLLSGGIDSTVAWATLMEVYDYQVYPLIINRGLKQRSRKELQAVKYLEKFFLKQYPDNYIRPFHFNVNPIPKESRETMVKKNVLPKDILLNFRENAHLVANNDNVIISRGNDISPYLTSFYGVFYANYLEKIKDIEIKDIFVGVNFSDSYVTSSQSFTALRTTLLAICSATANYNWNFSSVFFERETGIMMDKADIVKLGYQLGVPLSKTWSCYQHKIFQCGNACATCVDRRRSFSKAGVEDKTVYLSNFDISPLINKFRGKFKETFNK